MFFYFERASHIAFALATASAAVLGFDPALSHAAPQKQQIINYIKTLPANCWAVINELTFGEQRKKVEREIIHVMFA